MVLTFSNFLYFLCACMRDFLVPLAIGASIQLIKVSIDILLHKRVTRALLRSAGWFPSVHSGVSASISTLMFFHYGIGSPEFAIAFTFSFLFRYDAANIRYQAWQHAMYLNKIHEELTHLLNNPDKTALLKERLGHTAAEVIGGILVGICLTIAYVTIIA